MSQRIYLTQPATDWAEATPIGCGSMGAMIFGGVANETLSLNEEHVWADAGQTGKDPRFPEMVQKLRVLLQEGKVIEA